MSQTADAPAAPASQTQAAPAAPATPAQTGAPAAPAAAALAATHPALAAMLPQTPAAGPAATPVATPVATPATPPAVQTATPAAAAPDTSKKTAEEMVAELNARLSQQSIRSFVVDIATAAQAHSPDQVLKLIADEFDVASDGRVFVKSDPRADAKAHVAKYLASNLHLLKPAVPGGGAGSPATIQSARIGSTAPVSTAEGGTANVRAFLGSMFQTTPAPANGGAAQAR